MIRLIEKRIEPDGVSEKGEKSVLTLCVDAPEKLALLSNRRKVLTIVKVTFFYCALSLALWSCGSEGPVSPSPKVQQNFSEARSTQGVSSENQKGLVSSSAAYREAFTNRVLALSSAKEAPDPKEMGRAELQEAMDQVLSESDPKTRYTLLEWLKPEIDKYPEAKKRLEEFQEKEGTNTDSASNQSDNQIDSVIGNTSAGEMGD